MYCIKCGEKLPDGATFCPSCGQKVSATENDNSDEKEKVKENKSTTSEPKILHLRCASCGGDMQVSEDEQEVTCPYCGAKEKILESDAVKTEKIKRDVEFAKMADQKERRVQKEQKEERTEYKHSRLAKATIIFAVICLICMFSAFSSKHILAGLIAMVQTGLFVASFLMGMQIVKPKRQRMHIATVLIAFLLIIFYTHASSIQKYERINWPSTGISENLPKPEAKYGDVWINNESDFGAHLQKVSESDYNNYVLDCKDMGYTIEATESDHSYKAYNADGYKVSVSLYSEKISIDLDAPLEASEFNWPVSNLAGVLPAPKSNMGKIYNDDDAKLSMAITNMSKDNVKAYIEEVINAGFTVDYRRDDDYYRASNDAGYYVEVNYEGNNKMTLSVKAPE